MKKKSSDGKSHASKWGIFIAIWLGLGAVVEYWEIFLGIAIVALPVFLIIRHSNKKELAEAEAKRAEREAKEAVERAEKETAEAERRAIAEAERASKEAAKAERKAKAEAERKRRYKAYGRVLESIPRHPIQAEGTPAKRGKASIVDEIPFKEIHPGFNKEKVGSFIALDLETTGLKAASDDIIEVAAIRFREWEPVEAFHTYCAPLRGLKPEAMAVNKITADMVHDKPTFGMIAKGLEAFLGSDSIVAHNLEFDLKFLTRYGVDLTAVDRLYYDTLTIAREYIPKIRERNNGEEIVEIVGYSLASFRSWYDIPNYKVHSALSDAYATGLLFGKLIDEINGYAVNDQ